MSIVPAHLFPPHLNAALGDAEGELHRAVLRLSAAGPLAGADRARRRDLFDLVRNFLRLVSIHKTFQGLDAGTPPRSRRPLILPEPVLATLPLLESALAELLPRSPDHPWGSPEFRVPWALACRLIAVRRELGPGAPPSGFPAPAAPSAPPSAPPEPQCPDAPVGRVFDPTSPAPLPTTSVSVPAPSPATESPHPSSAVAPATSPTNPEDPSPMGPIGPIGPILRNPAEALPDAPALPAAQFAPPCLAHGREQGVSPDPVSAPSASSRLVVPAPWRSPLLPYAAQISSRLPLIFVCIGVNLCASVVTALSRIFSLPAPGVLARDRFLLDRALQFASPAGVIFPLRLARLSFCAHPHPP